MKTVCSALVALFALSLTTGCGDDDGQSGGGGQAGTTTAASTGSSTTSSSARAQIVSVRAPTRTRIEIQIDQSSIVAPTAANLYDIVSERGPLEVLEVAIEEGPQRVVLTTEKQKLGVEYQLVVRAPGNELDLQGGKFLAADTATFWATDFSDFSDYEVTARRLEIGQNVVLYATDDVVAGDVDETIAAFDEQIFPELTALLHAAPDRDDNGRIVLLGLDGNGYYGGYFSPVDSLTKAQVPHSNEMEMLYISIPDSGGFNAEHVVTHEFSHLLYNEAHDFSATDWSWHNEGLAECAVHAVWGVNDTAAYYYTHFPELIDGQSLVIWQYSNYAQYVQAYVFWTYVASQLGGVSAYGDLFDQTGSPADMAAFFQTQLGKDFPDVQLDMLTAGWLRQPTGTFGFNGMLTLDGPPQSLPITAPPEQMLSFEAVLFTGASGPITPTGQGSDVRYRAIDAAGTVSETIPLASTGGTIIALNAATTTSMSTQSSGLLSMAFAPSPAPLASRSLGRDLAWMHPPPVKPANRKLLEAWRLQTAGF